MAGAGLRYLPDDVATHTCACLIFGLSANMVDICVCGTYVLRVHI